MIDDRDRQLLRRLVESYARAADRRDPEAFAAVFTDDGVLSVEGHDMRGRDALLLVAPRLSKYRVTEHLVVSHHVDLGDAGSVGAGSGDAGSGGAGSGDADVAVGEVSCIASHVYDRDGTDRVRVMHIRYDDRYRRTEHGWRIEERRLVLLFEEDRPLAT